MGIWRLTNTRYADDVLLHARSLQQLEHLTELLISELRRVGLELNAGKSEILHSEHCGLVKILHPDRWHRYLGRRLSLSSISRIDIECKYRKHQAWASFRKYERALFNKQICLQKRLKYFDSCVTPSVIFALYILPMSK